VPALADSAIVEGMKSTSRRAFVGLAALAAVAAVPEAAAQFGGRSRDRGGGAGSGKASHSDEGGGRRGAAPAIEPGEAIERELPSLRIDLKLTPEQAALFDSYERQVRLAADAERMRARHVAAFRTDDGSTVKAKAVLTTIADDDTDRADAARLAVERMQALYAVLTPDQQRQFDERTIQSLRDPLGTS
jgi:Spy/CpxP family protein refolding chaperone